MLSPLRSVAVCQVSILKKLAISGWTHSYSALRLRSEQSFAVYASI